MGGNLVIVLVWGHCKILHFFQYTNSFFEATAFTKPADLA